MTSNKNLRNADTAIGHVHQQEIHAIANLSPQVIRLGPRPDDLRTFRPDSDTCFGKKADGQQVSGSKCTSCQYCQSGFQRAKHATGFLVIYVEQNPGEWQPELLEKDQYLVDLTSASAHKKPPPGWRKPWAPDTMQVVFECALA